MSESMTIKKSFRLRGESYHTFKAFAEAAGLTFSELIRLAIDAIVELGEEVSRGDTRGN